jgi:hypothetical protein
MTNSQKLPLIAACLMLGLLFNPPGNYTKNRANPQNAERAAEDSACRGAGPKGCVELALQAMGGGERIASVDTLRLEEIGNPLLTEQSYRQEPFITSYEPTHETIDFKRGRVRRESHLTWPESDSGQAESDAVLIASAAGGGRLSLRGRRSAVWACGSRFGE